MSVSPITLGATFPTTTAVTVETFTVKGAITADDTTWDAWVDTVEASTTATATDTTAITLFDGFVLAMEVDSLGVADDGIIMRSNPPDSDTYNFGAIALL